MLHILFSILMSLGTIDTVQVTKVETVKKMDVEKKEVIWASVDDDLGVF